MTALETIQDELDKHARLPLWEQAHVPHITVTVLASEMRALVDKLADMDGFDSALADFAMNCPGKITPELITELARENGMPNGVIKRLDENASVRPFPKWGLVEDEGDPTRVRVQITDHSAEWDGGDV